MLQILDLNHPLGTTIIIYLAVIGALLVLKPKFIFEKNGNLKKFATGSGRYRTVFPLWLIFAVVGIIIYFVVISLNYNMRLKNLCKSIKTPADLKKFMTETCQNN